MTNKITRNRNTNDSSNVDQHTTTTDLAENIPGLGPNAGRTYLSVVVRGENGWLRELDESVDPTVRTGIFLLAGVQKDLPVDNIYPGQYSLINDKNGKHPTIHFTER